MTEREEIIANAEAVRQTICGTLELEKEKATLQQELAVLVEMTEKAVMQNTRIAQRLAKSERLAGFIKMLEVEQSL